MLCEVHLSVKIEQSTLIESHYDQVKVILVTPGKMS